MFRTKSAGKLDATSPNGSHSEVRSPMSRSNSFLTRARSSIFDFEMDGSASSRYRLSSYLRTCSATMDPVPDVVRPWHQAVQGPIQPVKTNQASKLVSAFKPSNSFEKQLAWHLREVMPSAGPDLEALAATLLSRGFQVQIRNGRDGGRQQGKQDCLKDLRGHAFMTCTGFKEHNQEGEPWFLDDPLIIEPRFREQFVIKFGGLNLSYEALLTVIPNYYVGTLRKLQTIVSILAAEIVSSFEQQGRTVPPWRTKCAMMSKWAPDELQELSKLLSRKSSAEGPSRLLVTEPLLAAVAVALSEKPAASAGFPDPPPGPSSQGLGLLHEGMHDDASALASALGWIVKMEAQGQVASRPFKVVDRGLGPQPFTSEGPGQVTSKPFKVQDRGSSPLHIMRMLSSDIRSQAKVERTAKSALAAELSGGHGQLRHRSLPMPAVEAASASSSSNSSGGNQPIFPTKEAQAVARPRPHQASNGKAVRAVMEDSWGTRINKVWWGSSAAPKQPEGSRKT